MNKKSLSLLLISVSLTLTGCFNSDGGGEGALPGPDANANQTGTYQSNQFTFTFPATWDVIEPKDFTSDIPGETQVVVRNNIKNDTFTANINIVKNSLQTGKSSLDYAKEILNRQRTGLLDYKETKREILNGSVGGQSQETYYTEFEARLNATDPVLKFVQTYAVRDNSGYIIMGAWSQQENSAVIDKVIASVKSFRVN